MELLIMQSSPDSCHFLPLRSKYSFQYPVLKHPQSKFLPYSERPPVNTYKTKDEIIVLYILIFKFLERREEYKILKRMVARFLEFNVLLISLPFLFATVVPKCSNLATFSKDLLAVSKL
jgi:hypothetical protein